MDAELQRVLTDAVGKGAVRAASDAVVASNGDAVATIVRICCDTGTPFSVLSGTGSKAGSAATGVLTLDLSKLESVEVHEGALTLHAQAGATVASLRSAADNARLAVIGLPEKTGAERVGGMLARGEVPRRSLCGIEAVLPTGEVVRTGGGVLKDVVGYDLAALLLGSMGRLAVVVAATFRLEPARAHTPVPPAPGITADLAGSVIAGAFDPQGLLRISES